MVDTAERTLHERAFSRIADMDLWGVAAVEETRGTPLHDSATSLLPGAHSIVVLAMEVFPEVVDLVVPEKQMGEAHARELYGPHMDYLHGRINRGIYELAKIYRDAGYRALPLPAAGTPFDARFLRGILSFKHAAVYAGLGTIGHSSLLITPQFGPRVRLGCLITTAEIPPTRRTIESDPCAICSERCIEQCPAGAIATPDGGQPYIINKFACTAYRNATGTCANCITVCPAGCK